MSKLLKVKKYLTIEEAAVTLSNSLEEPVKVSDIYDLALENEITISIRLANKAFAVGGRYVNLEGHETGKFKADTDLLTGESLDVAYSVSASDALLVEEGKWLVFDDEIIAIDGVWDLTMIGVERQIVHGLYQNEVGGALPKPSGSRSFLVERGDVIYKLKTSLPLQLNEANSSALQIRLTDLLESKGLTYSNILDNPYALDNLSDDELEEYSQLTLALSDDDLEESEEIKLSEQLIGSDEHLILDDFSYQFVIRTNELTRFVQSLDDDMPQSTQTDKPLGSRERNTLLTLIGVLSEEAGIELSVRGITTSIQYMMDKKGIAMSGETIRKVIRQVTDVMESRSN
ncbi:hypothetical protein VITU102760_05210 [Vibrio tubiashii]|uniref:Uncharacterized protein n=1 Tax=Vibrio tubiashii ATCC 19109 TaxID=1051646 RepID=F9T146_9VIBR|nr:hypothetical protein [Vibrio tubiashii]AIW16492.1 hypothetical protein IX91_20620 [Vibrio tubiashii ATCC 19109]EGU58504.1 hypothetical protein VITU9109_07309 [Vibrio tubiashii ATCC 19109]EIF04859.1 hypothetical protein VT1337_06241 [Vibrio tubiashii NCIMB 1337 = ATCC 19106]